MIIIIIITLIIIIIIIITTIIVVIKMSIVRYPLQLQLGHNALTKLTKNDDNKSQE